MSISILASLILASPASMTPAEVISEVFKRYHGAKELSATVKFTIVAGNEGLSVDSALQYQRPNKLFIHQQGRYKGGKSATVIGDGSIFTYEMPASVAKYPGQRAVERQGNLKVEEMFAIASSSLVDKSPLIETLVAKKEHLQAFKEQLATLNFADGGTGEDNANYTIIGDWREYGRAPVTGKYKLVINSKFDVVSLTCEENAIIPPNTTPTRIRTMWEADVKYGTIKDEKLFTIPKGNS